jgi:hypothetical protein
MPSGRKPYAEPLTVEQVLAWADAHKKRMGRLPNANSGRAACAPREDWGDID